MNLQIKNPSDIKAPVTAIGAAVGASILMLDLNGSPIISTLPSEYAAGADLFGALRPADRERLAIAPETLESDRFFFCSDKGAFILLTFLAASHGIVFAIQSGAVSTPAFKSIAAQYGFEELACSSAPADSTPCDGAEVGSVIRLALELERCFSESGGAHLTSRRNAEKFFCEFSRFAGVRARVVHTARRCALFDAVDYRVLGLAALAVSAFARTVLGTDQMSVTIAETDDRHSAKVEFIIDSISDSLPGAQEIESLFDSVFAFKCKNFCVLNRDSSLVFSLCPAIFDPNAEGLMQNNKISRLNHRKGLKK